MSIMEEPTMNKLFVPYKKSLELKELGFDEPCIRGWDKNRKIWYHPDSDIVTDNPTYSQAFRWFRNKYKLPSHIATYWQHDWNNYSYQYYFVQDKVEWNNIEHYKTYEEAELACLRKLIDIVKEKY